MVSNSIIGRRCRIGKNVTIQNAYIWDDVVIGDGSTIDRAVVASEAVIGKKCKIQPGSLLSYGVRIADNKETREGARITRAKQGEPLVAVPTDTSIVGNGGEGYQFSDEDDSDDEGTAFHSNLIYSTSHLNLSNESISTLNSNFSSATPTQSRSRLSSFAGSISDDGDPSTSNETFHHDAVNGLLDALKEGDDFDSAKLEFMGLRLSNNASDHQVRRAIAVAFTKRIAQLVEGEKMEATKAAAKAFGAPGAEKFLKEVAVGTKNLEDDQVDFITCLQKDLVHRGSGPIILAAVIKELYQMDVLEEEAILRWWEESEVLGEAEDKEMKRVREKTAVLITWFRDNEGDSSEEDEEEDDSD
jgi:translation initiation factor eIF-2B subunit epsilon